MWSCLICVYKFRGMNKGRDDLAVSHEERKKRYRRSPHFVMSEFVIPAISWFGFSTDFVKIPAISWFWKKNCKKNFFFGIFFSIFVVVSFFFSWLHAWNFIFTRHMYILELHSLDKYLHFHEMNEKRQKKCRQRKVLQNRHLICCQLLQHYQTKFA